MTTTGSVGGVDVVLRDGSTVHVRATGPNDAGLVEEFFERLSAESLYLRFFAPTARWRC